MHFHTDFISWAQLLLSRQILYTYQVAKTPNFANK